MKKYHSIACLTFHFFLFNISAGETNPSIKWIKVDGEISANAQYRGTRLVFLSIAESDSGTYRCLASNIAGTMYAQVTVIVQGKFAKANFIYVK